MRPDFHGERDANQRRNTLIPAQIRRRAGSAFVKMVGATRIEMVFVPVVWPIQGSTRPGLRLRSLV